MDDDAKLAGRVDQATKLAILIKAYRAGAFRARNDEERALLADVDALLNPVAAARSVPPSAALEPLSSGDYLGAWDGLQQRVDLLENAWRRGMGRCDTPEQRQVCADVERLLGLGPSV